MIYDFSRDLFHQQIQGTIFFNGRLDFEGKSVEFHHVDGIFNHPKVGHYYSPGNEKTYYHLAILLVTFLGWLSDPFKWLSDLQLGGKPENHQKCRLGWDMLVPRRVFE